MGLTYLPFAARAARAPAVEVPPTLERATAAAALLATVPILLPALAAVRLLSKQSPLVAHRRVGLRGDPIWVLKLRTMWEREGGSRTGGWIEYLQEPPVPACKLDRDPRVTSRFAAFLRRHSIDELPQLWHVITGQMQLVGPRPMTHAELVEHYVSDAAELLSVRPGLTGLWQVMGRNRLTYAQRRRLDLFYVRRATWKLYARVLARTVGEVLVPRSAY